MDHADTLTLDLTIFQKNMAALREVETPLGVRLQGFVVAPSGVEEWLGADASARIDFVPAGMPDAHMHFDSFDYAEDTRDKAEN